LDSIDRVRAANGRGTFDDTLACSLSGSFGSHLKSAHSVTDLFCDAIQFACCHECSLITSLTSHVVEPDCRVRLPMLDYAAVSP
jgi:hypothetical protein